MKFQRIIFLQGEEANEALELLDLGGYDSAIEYLAQWDHGDDGELFDFPSNGTSDRVHTSKDGYRLTYNMRQNYIGLEMEIEEASNASR